MKSLAPVLMFVLLSVHSTSAHRVCYVKPNSPPQDCPSQPCFTLDQYTQQTEKHFTTGAATFLFLPGSHSLQTSLNLINVSNLTLKGRDKDSIISLKGSSILCENVTNLTITGLIVLNSNNLAENLTALKIVNSTGILISNSKFQGSRKPNDTGISRALLSSRSVIKIEKCLFEGNVGDYGGAIYADESDLTITGNTFTRNKAAHKGGAIYAHKSLINLKGNTNGYENITLGQYNTQNYDFITDIPDTALFTYNRATEGGAISLTDSNATFSGSLLVFRGNSAERGGGIHFMSSSMSNVYVTSNSEHLYFIENTAELTGSAVLVSGVSLVLGESLKNNHYFLNNSEESIYSDNNGEVEVKGNSYFINNGHNSMSRLSAGGAIRIDVGFFTMSGNAMFSFNTAAHGGAIYLYNSNAFFDMKVLEFIGNAAEEGAGIYSLGSKLIIKAERLDFIDNIAQARGGAIAVICTDVSEQVIITGNFINNSGRECGGALYVEGEINVTLVDIVALGNSESAICVFNSKVAFTGRIQIVNNTGTYGGGINSQNSELSFEVHSIEFGYNNADIGGAIYLLYGTVGFWYALEGGSLFAHNTATLEGGAIYAIDTDITLWDTVYFISNTAQNGGALYFKSAVTLTLETDYGAHLSTEGNYAFGYGGAMYYEDAATQVQCNSALFGISALIEAVDDHRIKELPYCFIHLKGENLEFIDVFDSNFDLAGKGGGFLFGGFLDRCRMDIELNQGDYRYQLASIVPYHFITETLLNIEADMILDIDQPDTKVTSLSYQLCFCTSNSEFDCTGPKQMEIFRGQKWSVSVTALDQVRTAVSTKVTAITSPNARLDLNQSPQYLHRNCSNLTYNLYSTANHERLILYPDGPCHDTGLARAVVNVTVLPCPDAFTQSQSGEECVCEERLRAYGVECTINERIYITRKVGLSFWMSILKKNGTYQGLVLYKTCPLDYCIKESANLILDQPDNQCDHNRSGVLCGKCIPNYSLLLGSSKCEVCSNVYLALLFPFAAAGIALVLFLSILRLTVATGMINSIILYANIVQANRNIFFTGGDGKNVLTVFIAWLNLDLGFQTCFYDGMDAYAQTWLQFAFPVYVWILIGLIVITSRYSITVSKLIGHNPIAVLATLLLMSYTKVLKIIIEVYSSVKLDYPNNEEVTVWLKDANVPYLRSKHLVVTVVTSLVLVFLFLPYTLLLLLGHRLYRFTGRKGLHWLNKVKPLLDSYHAPYKTHTRYWTGFLLLVRCALYIVFSFNSLGATNKSLLAINVTFTALVIIAWLSVLIYKKFYVNVIEASVYLNLIVASAVTSNGENSPALVFFLVATVFITMMGTIVYHFHLLYTAKSPTWLKIKAKLTKANNTAATLYPVVIPTSTSSHDAQRIVTKTVIDLREPLLDN